MWSAFGRHVVTNLTTVTTAVRGFTVLMLGRTFAHQLREKGKVDEDGVLDLFLRCEQLGAYARHLVHGGQGILGIERVTRNAREGGGKVWIDASSRGRILSDQKTYGLWGLYTVSARASGLLDFENRPSPATLEHLDQYAMPHLRPVLAKVERLLCRGGQVCTRRNDPVLAAFGRCLGDELEGDERAFYASYLRDAEHATEHGEPGPQAIFRALLESHGELQERTGRVELERLAAAARPKDEGLAHRLERILQLEAFLAPVEALFGFLQARHGQEPHELAASLHDRWGADLPHLDDEHFDALRPEVVQIVGDELAAALKRTYAALATGDYVETVHALLDWNRVVMAHRNAAPWIRLDDGGRLDVRYRGSETPLPDGEELAELWNNPYFLDSLKAITLQLREGSR